MGHEPHSSPPSDLPRGPDAKLALQVERPHSKEHRKVSKAKEGGGPTGPQGISTPMDRHMDHLSMQASYREI